MDKRQIEKKALELGYVRERQAKHGELWRHGVTGETVEIPGTPGDHRSLKNTLADLERGAVTDGRGHLRFGADVTPEQTLPAACAAVLQKAPGPLKSSEIVAAVAEARPGVNPQSVSAALSLAVRDYEPVLRLRRGWYVCDPDLAALPPTARESAIGMIAEDPRRAYREGLIRQRALRFARSLVEEDEPCPQYETGAPEDAEDPTHEEPQPEPRPSGAVAASALFELVAEEPGGAVAVLRGEDGRLWVARALNSVAPVGEGARPLG